MEVSRSGILLSWLAVAAILLVVGAAFHLAMQGLVAEAPRRALFVLAAFAFWVAVLAYRLVRGAVAISVAGSRGSGRSG